MDKNVKADANRVRAIEMWEYGKKKDVFRLKRKRKTS